MLVFICSKIKYLIVLVFSSPPLHVAVDPDVSACMDLQHRRHATAAVEQVLYGCVKNVITFYFILAFLPTFARLYIFFSPTRLPFPPFFPVSFSSPIILSLISR